MVEETERPGLSDHPVVVGSATLAAIITVIAFLLDAPLPPARSAITLPQTPIAQPASTPLPVVDAAGAPGNVSPANAAGFVVVFQNPRDGQTVGERVDVQFIVRGQPPAGRHMVLLVRDPLGQYWSYGPITPGERRTVQIGTAADRGRRFEIGLLATSERLPLGTMTQARPVGSYQSVGVMRGE